jgi:phosphatidylglycerophosphatase A
MMQSRTSPWNSYCARSCEASFTPESFILGRVTTPSLIFHRGFVSATKVNSGKKQRLAFERFRDVRGRLSLLIATALGAGLIPKAPGTMGALVGVPLAWATADFPLPWRVAIAAFLLVIGTWASHEWEIRAQGGGDDQRIVIDEVMGLYVTSLPLGSESGTWAWVAAFILFRFFDIVKPPPVRAIDMWSKASAKAAALRGASSSWTGAFGVMADDLVAGFQGLLVLSLLMHFVLSAQRL